jgi:hypothetical protein
MAYAATPSLGAIHSLILDLVPHLEPSPRPPGPGRPPIVPLALLWSALLFTMLDGPLSQRAVWSRITSGGIPRYPALVVTNEAIRQRLLSMDPATMADAFATITAACQATLAPHSSVPAFPGGIFALDTTTLDKVARPLLGETERPLAGRIHTLYDVSRQLFHTVILTPKPREHEQVAAPDLLAQVPPRSLVVMDRGYTSYPRFDALTAQGQAFITRLRENAAFTTRHVMSDTPEVRDELIWLGAYRADRAGQTYRLVTIRTRQAVRRYLTNVLKPTILSPAQVAACYRERWEIERAFATLKGDLGLAWIWSRRTEVIWLQVWATLLLAQIMSAVRGAVAARAEVPIAQVSMTLLIRSAPTLLAGREGDLIEIMARDGPNWGLIRPVRRVTIDLPEDVPWTPWPGDWQMTRASRYARKP